MNKRAYWKKYIPLKIKLFVYIGIVVGYLSTINKYIFVWDLYRDGNSDMRVLAQLLGILFIIPLVLTIVMHIFKNYACSLTILSFSLLVSGSFLLVMGEMIVSGERIKDPWFFIYSIISFVITVCYSLSTYGLISFNKEYNKYMYNNVYSMRNQNMNVQNAYRNPMNNGIMNVQNQVRNQNMNVQNAYRNPMNNGIMNVQNPMRNQNMNVQNTYKNSMDNE